MSWIDQSRAWARRIKRDGLTLWFACKHPHTPWYAKTLGAFVVSYALSPIDLIPDFIPVLGYLDDVILLPLLISLTLRLLPQKVLADARAQAEDWIAARRERPRSRWGAVGIALIWVGLGVAVVSNMFIAIPDGVPSNQGALESDLCRGPLANLPFA